MSILSYISDRLGGKNFYTNGGYKMEEIKQLMRQFSSAHPDLLIFDFGIGEPDLMPPQAVIDDLSTQANVYKNRTYADNGCHEFRFAAARYMSRVFHVDIDPDAECIHCIGAKSALSMLPSCFINPGDVVAVTTPGYPIFQTHVQYIGGNIFPMPLLRCNHFLPDLAAIPADTWKQIKIVSINYPNNPTSAQGSVEFFTQLVYLAKQYNFLIINDAAYASLCTSSPVSILQVHGAKDVSVEIHSMSKAYNMTGWRLGWVCGNADIIRVFSRVKDNTDSGQFLAIQKAAITALEDISFPKCMEQRYQSRRSKLINILSACGFQCYLYGSGFFVYVLCPTSAAVDEQLFTFSDARSFQRWILETMGILVIDWDCLEPSIRFSLTFKCTDDDQFFSDLQDRLSGLQVHY